MFRRTHFTKEVLLYLLRFVRFHFCSHQSMWLLISQSCVPFAMEKFHYSLPWIKHKNLNKIPQIPHRFQSLEIFKQIFAQCVTIISYGKLLKFIWCKWSINRHFCSIIRLRITNIDWKNEWKSELIDINGNETKFDKRKIWKEKKKSLSSAVSSWFSNKTTKHTKNKAHTSDTLWHLCARFMSIYCYTLSLACFCYRFFPFQLAYKFDLKNSFSGNILAIRSMRLFVCIMVYNDK